ncbi:MFS transporter [Streptomyces sp. SID8379]|uniref:MFS transporter n=1 Tax=unclassified Streptomyces TaxID=2593676 RepID=UPI00037106F6|nr:MULTISPECIES: MFS transporter [unclassified Streptomyces]MYW64673.1 MFS transporter [Streptomyces sp. SID8379]
MVNSRSLTVGRMAGWGVGAFASNAFNTLPGLLLLIYMTDALGVPAALAGVVVAVPKLFDLVASPWLGAVSDREATRTGRRRRLMTSGALILPFAFVATFSSPVRGDAAALWVFAAFLAASAAYLCFQVPFTALPAEMSELPRERTRLMTWRTLFFTLGMLVGGVAGPLMTEKGTPAAYRTMSVIIGVVLLVVLLVPVLSTRQVRSRPAADVPSLRAAFRTARGNRPFVLLSAVLFLYFVFTVMILTGLPYAATYFLGGKKEQATVFLVFALSSTLAVPGAGALARRYGNVPVLLTGLGLWAAGGVALYGAVGVGVAATAAVSVLAALGQAAGLVAMYALLTDCVRIQAERTGHDSAGVLSGVWTAVDTAGHALGPVAYTVVLSLTGYASSTLDHPVTQSATALEGIRIAFSALPGLLLLTTLPLVLRYRRAVSGPMNGTAAQPADA